jgi:hypothetical protein
MTVKGGRFIEDARGWEGRRIGGIKRYQREEDAYNQTLLGIAYRRGLERQQQESSTGRRKEGKKEKKGE